MNDTSYPSFSLFNPSLFPSPSRPSTPAYANLIFPLSLFVCIISLTFPRSLRQALPIPIIIGLFHYVRQFESPIDFTDNYMTNIHLLWTLIRWIDFTLIHQPEQLIRVDGLGDPIETADDIKSYPWPRKLVWSANLMTSIRGVRWNWQVNNIPHIDPDRLAAVFDHIFIAIKYNLILDFRDYLALHHLLDPVNIDTYFALPLWHQTLYVMVGILNSAAGIGLGYHALAAVCTATHLTHPRSWPPMFGSWAAFTTVRGAWGKLWHQMLRRFFTVSNDLLLNALGIKRGTTLSSYTQIYFAFLLSALFHHVGALNIPYMESVRYQFLFFLLQPVCITIEDILIALAGRAGLQRGPLMGCLCLIWTFCALAWMGRYMAVYFSESGAMLAPNPVLVGGIWERVLPVPGAKA
jgi:hypothetical protein